MSKYPQDWQTTTLGEICVSDAGLQTGPFGSQLHASDYTETGVPVVMPKDIESYRVSTADIARIPEELAATLSRHRLLSGDIVFGRRGDIGRCALITLNEQGWLCGTGCLRARIKQATALPEFLIFYLDLAETKSWLETNAVGQTMLNLNTSILAELPVLLPPLPEQRKMAAILGTWDEAIALIWQLIAALQQRKQALMQLLLIGKVRFQEFAEEEWNAVKFADAPLDLIDGDRGENYPKQHEFLDSGYCLFLNAGNVTGYGFDFSRCLFVSEEKDKILKKGKLTRHDVVLTTRGTVGNVAYYDESVPFENIRLNSGMVILRSHAGKLNPNYLYMYARSPLFESQVKGFLSGSAQPQLPISIMRQLEIALPSLTEQGRIASVFNIVEEQLQAFSNYLSTLKSQKRGLMQQLLTGAVRVEEGI